MMYQCIDWQDWNMRFFFTCIFVSSFHMCRLQFRNGKFSRAKSVHQVLLQRRKTCLGKKATETHKMLKQALCKTCFVRENLPFQNGK